MPAITEYFAHIPSSHRSLILIGGLVGFMLLESGVPLLRQQYSRWSHAGINLFFTLTTVIVNFAMASLLLRTSDYVTAHHVGLLQWLPAMPLWLFALVGLLLLDLLGAYAAHWAEHRVRWMWRFHLIHHTDPNVDTTTANRHHPGESVIRFAFTTIGTAVLGAPIWLVFLYQSLSALLSQFNHANIRMPAAVERALDLVIVTPTMHRVHHHHTLPHTDTNYGNIFSLWDRMFGTYAAMDNRQIVFGIDTHPEPAEHSRLLRLLRIPFEKYRMPVGAKFEQRTGVSGD